MPDWRTAHFKEKPKPPPPRPRRWLKVVILIGLPIVVTGSLALADQAGIIDVQSTAHRWLEKVKAAAGSGTGSAPTQGTSDRAPAASILNEDKGTASPKDGASFNLFDPDPAAAAAPAAAAPENGAKRASLERGINLMSRELAPIEADIAWRTEQLVIHATYYQPPTAAERESLAVEYINAHPRMSSIEASRVNQALGNARTDMRNHRQRIKEQAEHQQSLNKRIEKAKAEMEAIP